MYLRICPTVPWDHFTYAIAKNPASPTFVRDLAAEEGDRRVTGRYVDPLRPELGYEVVVENDARKLVDRLRAENRASYVSAAPYAVSPRNLKAAAAALKSALDGKVVAPLAPEQFFDRRAFLCAIGPFTGDGIRVIETYARLGLYASGGAFFASGFSDDGGARVVSLSTMTPVDGPQSLLSLTEFLQRVFVGAYALTARDHEGAFFHESLVDSLIERSRDWLWRCDNREWVLRQLSHYRKKTEEKFRAALVEAAEAVPPGDDEEERAIEDAVEEVRESPRLHDLRHGTVVRELVAAFGEATTVMRIVDLGCGDGKLAARLAEAFPNARVLGVDAGGRVERALKKLPRSRYRLLRGNLLYPYLEESDLRPDALVLSEVIEHLGPADRSLLIQQVAHVWRPRVLAITTPHRHFNPVWGVYGEEFRHKDHRIEYTPEDLEREVLAPLRVAGYACRSVPIADLDVGAYVGETLRRRLAEGEVGQEEAERVADMVRTLGIQPSFVVVAERKDSDGVDPKGTRLLHKMRSMRESVPLEEVGYVVGPDEIQEGLAHPVFRHHLRDAFYLSPTMAPVDWDPAHPDYLEHPAAAFEYYRRRGVREVVVEEKYMGSRCHLLIFRDEEVARRAGRDHPLVAVSRGGFPFFDAAERDALWARVKPRIREDAWREDGLDFVMVDAEVLPWSLKAGRRGDRSLIAREFRGPGEAARLYAQLRGDSGLEARAGKFLEALSWFDGEGEVQVRPFGLLAEGAVEGKGRFSRVCLGESMTRIGEVCKGWRLFGGPWGAQEGGPFVRTQQQLVYLEDVASMAAATLAWEEYTTSGCGEGYVVKPLDAGARSPNGAPLQPALKVRGREYLRIIYGIDYLEPEIFEKLKARQTRAKRRVAIQEYALGRRILISYLRGMHREHARYVAAFLGMDGVAARELDATL